MNWVMAIWVGPEAQLVKGTWALATAATTRAATAAMNFILVVLGVVGWGDGRRSWSLWDEEKKMEFGGWLGVFYTGSKVITSILFLYRCSSKVSWKHVRSASIVFNEKADGVLKTKETSAAMNGLNWIL